MVAFAASPITVSLKRIRTDFTGEKVVRLFFYSFLSVSTQEMKEMIKAPAKRAKEKNQIDQYCICQNMRSFCWCCRDFSLMDSPFSRLCPVVISTKMNNARLPEFNVKFTQRPESVRMNLENSQTFRSRVFHF